MLHTQATTYLFLLINSFFLIFRSSKQKQAVHIQLSTRLERFLEKSKTKSLVVMLFATSSTTLMSFAFVLKPKSTNFHISTKPKSNIWGMLVAMEVNITPHAP